MISVDYVVEIVPLVSCDFPHIQGALEVRPRVRKLIRPPVPSITNPRPLVLADLKPSSSEVKVPVVVPVESPRPISAVELKPIPKKAEED